MTTTAPAAAAAPQRRARLALEHGLLGVLPLVLTAWLLYQWSRSHTVAVDFDHAYWSAGQRVIHGISPYTWTRAEIVASWAFVYPAVAAVSFVPLSLLPRGLGDALMTFACLMALAGMLVALGVRDWRIYGAALLWSPVVAAWHTANVSLLLALGVALIWRYRDRPLVAGLLCAVVISIKPFIWPVGLWLLVTRRYRATGIAVVTGLVLNVVAWAAIGLHEVHAFLHLSSVVTDYEFRQGYGVLALAAHFGIARGPAYAVEALLAVALLLACVIAARRGRELAALTISVATMLIASPLVWNHYFVLLIVPLALTRPRLSGLWLVPLALWVCPAQNAATWQVLVAWAVVGGLFITLLRSPPVPGSGCADVRA
jgi:alpha-1,2-mannosyltransferase